MEKEPSYASAVEHASYAEYVEVERQLSEAVKELDELYHLEPDSVPLELIQRITYLQQESATRLSDWLESLGLA